MTSSTTGDRRWGTTRRSGMTILGKVAVPKPINLPSQRLENQGLDPNVEIVPKGTLSWGSKSSANAWGTSSLSPRTESGHGSPSHLSNRPSSGGSVTRPSTADSDKAHESSSITWDSNSRPSSASGVFPNQASVAVHRPHSADTRPGSSQLSRFSEAVSETAPTWGQNMAAEKLGVALTKNDGFSLTSGDFPSLGAEKESSDKISRPQDVGPCARPASSSGRYVEDRGVNFTEEANVRVGDANVWRRDNQPYCEDAPAPRHCREEGQLGSHGSQTYPNANFPHQYEAWRGPPVNNHQGGGWYRGNHPYGAPMGPGGIHMDPYPFYPTHVPPVHGHGAGPRGNPSTNEKMFRPPVLDSYGHPRVQTRPGFYLGPAPFEGYYGPPMGYGNPSNSLPFAGRPAGPHAYSKHSGQGGYDTPGSSVALEQNEPSRSQETQRQYKVLLKPQDGRFGEDIAKREEFIGNRFLNAEQVAQQMQTSKNDKRENNNEASGEVQPIKAENAAPEDPSLIKKIESLNAKTRTNNGWKNASSFVNRGEQDTKTRIINSGNSVNKVSARNPRTGHASDSENSLQYQQGDLSTKKNTELEAISGAAISRRSTQQAQARADCQTKHTVNSEGNDGWRNTTVMSGSSRATLAANSESFPEANVVDSLDSIRKPGPGILADPNDNQRSTMRELARQRAQQRQKEEEERARDQRAKALAKLEELNRRSQVSEDGSVKNLEAASSASVPDLQEDSGSLSPAFIPSNLDNVQVRSSFDMKTTVAAAKSIEPSGKSGKTSMQEAMASTGNAYNVGPTHQDYLPRGRDGNASKERRLGYKQKQNIVFEKTMAGNSFSAATTDILPSREIINEGVLSHNSEVPATSSVSTDSSFTKRKNNRNGKKKHKLEETTPMNTTRVANGKEAKRGDESIDNGGERADETELGSVSVPSLDIKVPGDLHEQISSSFTNEESQSREKSNWKSQHLRRTQRNSSGNKPADKFFTGSNAVIWAPVHPQQKTDVSIGVGSQNTVPECGTSSKSLHQGQSSAKSKRVEIERYVAKPIVKETAEPTVSKSIVTAAPGMMENVLPKGNCGGECSGILQPSGSTAGKSGSPSKSRQGNGRQGKHGKEHGSWHQRGSAASTKALEDGQFVTSSQPIRGLMNYPSSNQTKQVDVGSAKDQTTCNDDGWNDGWYMPPEPHYSAPEKLEANTSQTVAVEKDQGMSIHGKQHASRSKKDGGSNYVDPKKANKRDYNKTHMQPSGHGSSQPDLHVASKESRGPGDHVSHTAVAPTTKRRDKYVGRESTKDKISGSERKDVAGNEHQGSTTEQIMTSADDTQSQNRSSNNDVQGEQNRNSMFQKNTGQSRRFGRGQESQGGWGSSAQEKMHHHHQRPYSNRDRQKQNMHYEYKPVGSRANDGEHNQEQLKDSSQTEGLIYREKGQSHESQRGTGHGIKGERN